MIPSFSQEDSIALTMEQLMSGQLPKESNGLGSLKVLLISLSMYNRYKSSLVILLKYFKNNASYQNTIKDIHFPFLSDSVK